MEDGTERGELTGSGEGRSDALECIVAPSRLDRVVTIPPTRVLEKVAQRDAFPCFVIDQLEIGQPTPYGHVEFEHTLFDQSHDRRAGHDLRNGAHLKNGGVIDRPASFVVPMTEMPRCSLSQIRDRQRETGHSVVRERFLGGTGEVIEKLVGHRHQGRSPMSSKRRF